MEQSVTEQLVAPVERTSWSSYTKIHALGHRLIRDIFQGKVYVEEKIDGSQISFGVFGDELKIRSRGGPIHLGAPDKMFAQAVATIRIMADRGLLRDGWTYRGEYLAKPNHNVLAYGRIPLNFIIGWDISDGLESYLSYEDKKNEFDRIGLETTPLLHYGEVADIQFFRRFLERESILGAQKIEGVVVKNYSKFLPDGKLMVGKFVSEAFKEIHNGVWKEANPSNSDVVDGLIESYKTPARWAKAVQRLREAGQLEDSPRDIGKIVAEIPKDIFEEETDAIKERLFQHFAPKIRRGCVGGVAEWYKEQLLKKSFEGGEDLTELEGPVISATADESQT